MGRKRDDAFILGTEPLEPENAEAVEERDRSEPEPRNAFAVAAEAPAEGPSPVSVTWRSPSRLLALFGLAAAAVAIVAILSVDGGERRRTVEPLPPPPLSEPVVESALSQPHRPPAPRREPPRRVPRPKPSKPEKRQGGGSRHEPAGEPALVTAPSGAPVAAPEPFSPPSDPSPPPRSGGGEQGERPEFSFER